LTPYLLLAAGAFTAQSLLVIPIVPVLIATGVLAAQGELHVGLAVIALTAGLVSGDSVWYVLGRMRGGRILSRICRAALEPASCVRRAHNVFGRFGARALLVVKFVPGLSTVALPMAGAYGMLPRRFLTYDAAGVLLWCSAYVAAGFVSARQVAEASPGELSLGWRLPGAVALAVVGYLLWKYVRRSQRSRQVWIDRIDAEQLQRRLAAREPMVVLDLRHAIEVENDPYTIPGALYFPAEELSARHREIPRRAEVVLVCSCPDQDTSVREALKLRSRGIRRVRPLAGGFEAWRDRGYPVEARGPAVAPDERILNAA
jgi:membrane protein DedA with SNARE-associated domain/rhodanese-related sulfurtransferase